MRINSAECANNLKNTGYGGCTFTPGLVAGFARVGTNFKLTATELASPTALKAYLKAQTLLDDPSQRMYPVGGVKGITNNSEAPVVETLADGTQVTVRQGYYNFKLRFIDGGYCLHQALLSWNSSGGTGGLYIFWDKNGFIMGTTALQEDGSRAIVGVPATFNEDPMTWSDGTTLTQFLSNFSFDTYYMNEALGFVKAGFQPSEIKGLQTLVIEQGTAAPAAGVLRLKVLVGCDYANVFPTYGTELADEALWVIRNATTNALIDITSVTADAPNQQFVVTLDSTDPDYPTTAAGLVTVTLVGPTELNAADIPSYEGNTLTIARG